MPQVNTNRNLLFAIMAVQMDFVSREAMFSGMLSWSERKEVPLGQILVERGELSTSRWTVLDQLLDEHIKAHAGDPARSLEALSSTDGVAEILTRVPDAQIQASLGYVREVQQSRVAPHSPDTVAPGGPATVAPPSFQNLASWTGRFRVVRPHAKGGLGVVSVAIDDELDREVAFKEIQDRHADHPTSRARFVLEAEITGKLEHPGIVPIYGLGHDAIGRPYYAMRFIRGDSLADAIHRFHDPDGPYTDPTKRALQLRELLGRFLDICDALAYAHSRGVLHRDLKPGNVMLGPFGETLVVDWGLALPLDEIPHGAESTHAHLKPSKSDSSSLPSEQGSVIGTPVYMAPEQAEGAIEKLGPRSDVYGLGAILYDLLTGCRPVQGETTEAVLTAVREGNIRPPRQIRSDLARPLEAICLKALALNPDDRYASPRTLATDIKSWLADEPVTAYQEPFSDRARRWTKRHRVLVSTLAASLLVGVIGLGIIAAVQTTARQNFDEQRVIAELHAIDAIEAIKKFRDAILAEPLLKQDEFKELRNRLLQAPQLFLTSLSQRLLAAENSRLGSLERLATAASEIGELTLHVGDEGKAVTAFHESINVHQKLIKLHPGVPQYQRELAIDHGNMGTSLMAIGKFAEASSSFQTAMQIQRRLVAENPKTIEYRRDLATTYNNLGALLTATRSRREALESLKAAISIQETLVAENSSSAEDEHNLALTLHRIGNLLKDTGQPTEALRSYQSALAIQQRVTSQNPSVIDYDRFLSNIHNNIGTIFAEKKQFEEARKAYQAALEIQKKLASDHPEKHAYLNELSVCQYNISTIEYYTSRFVEAQQHLVEAIESQRKALSASPTNSQYRQFMRILLAKRIRVCQASEDRKQETQARYEFDEFLKTDPTSLALDARLTVVLNGKVAIKDTPDRLALARHAFVKGLHATATRLWREALKSERVLAEDRQAQHCYYAACAAAMAGSGQGKDTPVPSGGEQTLLRRQAMEWLKGELSVWEKSVDAGAAQDQGVVKETLEHWKKDSDLAGVREPKELTKLPEAERKEWEALWREVDRVLAKVKSAP